jgi:lysophospholipase L1-like esterase
MKRFLLFLVLLCSCFLVKAQTYTNRGTGFGYVDNALKIPYAFAGPSGSTPTLNGRPGYQGSLFYVDNGRLFVYDSTTATWNPLAWFSDILTPARGLFSRSDSLYVDSTVVTFVDTTNEIYDTIPIFNLVPTGSSLPAAYGGTATNYTVSGGKIIFNGPGSTINYISYDTGTMSEHFVMTASIICDSLPGNEDGVLIGIVSQNVVGSNESVMAGFTFNESGFLSNAQNSPYGTGVMFGTTALDGSGVFSSIGNNTVVANGDTINYTLTRNGNTYFVVVNDVTQNWLIEYPIYCNTYGIPFVPNNTGFPAIYALGGKYSVLNWTYSILKPKNLILAIEGNSITFGEKASDQSSDWANNIAISKNNVVQGGGGDITASLLLRIPEIIKLHPKYAPTMMGGNDILDAVSVSVWQQNLRQYRDTLANHGIAVIWIYPTPRNVVDLTPLVTFLDTCISFTNDLKIRNTWYGMKDNSAYGIDSIYNSGDGIHPNDLGHKKIADIINDSLYLLRIVTPEYPRYYNDKYLVNSGRNIGQSLFGGSQPGSVLFLGGSSYADGGLVNLQNTLYGTTSGIGINTLYPQAPLDVNGILRVGSGYSVNPALDRTYGEIFGGNTGVNYIGISTAGQQASGNSVFMLTGQGINGVTVPYCYLSTAGYLGIGASSYNFITTINTSNHLTSLFTTFGNGLSDVGGDIELGDPGVQSQFTAYFDMTNRRLGINGIVPSYALDVRDHINGVTEPANTNNTLMASTAYADRAAAGTVAGGSDAFNATSSQTLAPYTPPTDINFHTYDVGVSLVFLSGTGTITVTMTWKNAQTGNTDSYSWPVATGTGSEFPVGLSNITINAFTGQNITTTVTVIGTVQYNINTFIKIIR